MHIKLKSLLTELADIETRLANQQARRKDEFMAKFGVGPLYKAKKPKTYKCPKCNKHNATLRSAHEDTEMECMELCCPDCKHCEEDPSPELLKESKTFQQIMDDEDPDGKQHDLTLTCAKCGTTQSCRCSKPKRTFTGICPKCSGK